MSNLFSVFSPTGRSDDWPTDFVFFLVFSWTGRLANRPTDFVFILDWPTG